MTEYSRMAQGVFVVPPNNGNAVYVNVPLPFVPDFVQLWYPPIYQAPQIPFPSYLMWNKFMPSGSAISIFESTNNLTVKTLATNGISPYFKGQSLIHGPQQAILGINPANPTVVISVANHGLSTGDVVIFENLYTTSTSGMPQFSGIPFSVTVSSPNHFSIAWDSTGSNYTAILGPPTPSFFTKLTNPGLYLPGVLFISSLTLGANTTVVTTTPHNLYAGQEVAFRIPPQWGTVQLNSSYNKRIPGAPVYGHVISVTNSTTVVVSVNSFMYTPFTVNIPVAQVPGLSFAQIVPVGDVSMSGVPLSPTNQNTYPSSTINGPNLQGSYVNNTSRGFTVGSAVLSEIVAGKQFIYEARLHDYSKGTFLTSI